MLHMRLLQVILVCAALLFPIQLLWHIEAMGLLSLTTYQTPLLVVEVSLLAVGGLAMMADWWWQRQHPTTKLPPIPAGRTPLILRILNGGWWLVLAYAILRFLWLPWFGGDDYFTYLPRMQSALLLLVIFGIIRSISDTLYRLTLAPTAQSSTAS